MSGFVNPLQLAISQENSGLHFWRALVGKWISNKFGTIWWEIFASQKLGEVLRFQLFFILVFFKIKNIIWHNFCLRNQLWGQGNSSKHISLFHVRAKSKFFMEKRSTCFHKTLPRRMSKNCFPKSRPSLRWRKVCCMFYWSVFTFVKTAVVNVLDWYFMDWSRKQWKFCSLN